MTLAELLKQKKKVSSELKDSYNFVQKEGALGLIILQDSQVLHKLLLGLRYLPMNFLVSTPVAMEIKDIGNVKKASVGILEQLLAFDFVVGDESVSDLGAYNKNGVVPVLSKHHHLGPLLREYNPLKNTGNAYLYTIENEWSMFHAIARYGENYKISFDNKNLVKNIYEQ